MDPIDLVVFSKKPRKANGEITLFSEKVRFIRIPKPFPNSNFETGKDILITQGSTYIRNPSLERSIKKHDKDPAFAVKAYLDIFGLEYDEKYITDILKQSTIVIKNIKNSFNRPRPKQLAPYFGVELDVLGSKTNNTPSYPSGHSTQSRLIAEIYGALYPDHRKNLIKAAEECGKGRVAAGFHYPSDHKAGVYLAKRMFSYLKEPKTNENTYYNRTLDLF
jgi:hypothetical protein